MCPGNKVASCDALLRSCMCSLMKSWTVIYFGKPMTITG
jgi:hypothetical protein